MGERIISAEEARRLRVLAVERGDASQAPDGWERAGRDAWDRVGALVELAQTGKWCWETEAGAGVEFTALEAMETADEALGVLNA